MNIEIVANYWVLCNRQVHLFKSRLSHQEKRPFSNGLFSIQSEGLACNLTAGEYVIAEGVWHHALACILLRIDYIQHFVLIPYRRQAADFIHAFAVILRVAFLYYEHISSVHNGFQLWTLDFFMLKSLFSFLLCIKAGSPAPFCVFSLFDS